uniref:PEPCK_GTP domain-containing protein n=1 Tax=Ascaris lumbricoides TaxID=6252 RepID=A0A0M3IXG6_ASCLU
MNLFVLASHYCQLAAVTDPRRREHFMTAAFPAACGKTSLAMLRPTLAGWKVRCIGDDIAWLRFGDDGRLYAINPEAGFFGIAPGLSKRTNPVAMAMLRKNCIFTNVAETANGEFFWQGLENEIRARQNCGDAELGRTKVAYWRRRSSSTSQRKIRCSSKSVSTHALQMGFPQRRAY